MKILFGEKIKEKREEIGQKWKAELPDFLIGIHRIKDEINLRKLISDQEIEEHQLFFEACAKEYGRLAEKLIQQLIYELGVQPHDGFPLKTLNAYKHTPYDQRGKMGEWGYFFHGYHCAFTHLKTKQHIEVPLVFGEEYGELDPYFFSIFIKSTPEFHPLPIRIYEDYADGKRILNVMLKLGKFEEINSNLEGKRGIVVKDRNKKEVSIVLTAKDSSARKSSQKPSSE